MNNDIYPDYWNQTITIYHKEYSSIGGKRIPAWTAAVVDGCFIGETKSGSMQSNHDDRKAERFVRMPLHECNINVGDVVAFGNPDVNITEGIVAEDIRDKIDGILVRTVKDNTFAPALKHFYVSGV